MPIRSTPARERLPLCAWPVRLCEQGVSGNGLLEIAAQISAQRTYLPKVYFVAERSMVFRAGQRIETRQHSGGQHDISGHPYGRVADAARRL